MDLNILSAILSIISTISVLFIAVLYQSNKSRKKRAEEQNIRAELSYIREKIERQIYELNEKLYSDSKRWQDVNHLLINGLDNHELQTSNKAIENTFFSNLGINVDNIEVDKNLVFFLTPFHIDFIKDYNVVKKTCENLNLKCSRGDEDFIKGNVLKYIIEKIMASNVVIANLNGRNPNVYYELGIAHSIGKPVILITNEVNLDNIPFDLRSNKFIIYKNENDLENRLTNSLAITILEQK